MKIVLHAIEVHGMPRLVVDQPIVERGDGVRLQNWTMDRYRDLSDMCKIHKGVTDQIYAEQNAPGGNPTKARNLSWHELWEMVFDKRRGTVDASRTDRC